jgi:hypothetical protein
VITSFNPKLIAEALAAWAEETLPKLSRKSKLAAAFRYMRVRWTALTRFVSGDLRTLAV